MLRYQHKGCPKRRAVAENTFRPRWYRMNIMSEFMGLIYGVYDAKPEGFVPGGMSLHNCMLPHGPDTDAFSKASWGEQGPVKLTNTLAFMFGTRFPQHLTAHAAGLPTLQRSYPDGWKELSGRLEGAGQALPRRPSGAGQALTACPSQLVTGVKILY